MLRDFKDSTSVAVDMLWDFKNTGMIKDSWGFVMNHEIIAVAAIFRKI